MPDPMNRFQVVIFDCDGVMFDSKPANEAFYNDIKTSLGLPPLTESELEYVHMGTAEGSIRHIVPENLLDRAFAMCAKVDYSIYLDRMLLAPGLKPLLTFLKKRCKTAVATNRSTTIAAILERFELTPYFDLVVSSLDVKNPKPDPDQLELILDRFRIPNEQAVFIGDSPTDARAARAAGVPFIAYRNPQLTADYHIRHFDEVKRIVTGD